MDGKKRLAWAAARVFLLMNGYSLDFDLDDAEATVIDVDRGEVEVTQLAAWLGSRLVALTE